MAPPYHRADVSTEFFDLDTSGYLDIEDDSNEDPPNDPLLEHISVPSRGASLKVWSDCVHKYQIQNAAQRKEIQRLRDLVERLEATAKGSKKVVDVSVPTELVKEGARLRRLGKLFAIVHGFWLSDAAYNFTERPNVDLADPEVYRSANPRAKEAMQAALLYDALAPHKILSSYLGKSDYVRDVMNAGINEQKSHIVSEVASVLPSLMPEHAGILRLKARDRRTHAGALHLHGTKGNHFPPLFYKAGHAGEAEHLFWVDALPGIIRAILFRKSAVYSEKVDTRSHGFKLMLSTVPIGVIASGLVIMRYCFSGEETFQADSPSCNNGELHSMLRATFAEFRDAPSFMPWFAWLNREVFRGTTKDNDVPTADADEERENNNVLAALRNVAAPSHTTQVASVRRATSGPVPRPVVHAPLASSALAPHAASAARSSRPISQSRSLNLPALSDDLEPDGPSRGDHQSSLDYGDDDDAITSGVDAMVIAEPAPKNSKAPPSAKAKSASKRKEVPEATITPTEAKGTTRRRAPSRKK